VFSSDGSGAPTPVTLIGTDTAAGILTNLHNPVVDGNTVAFAGFTDVGRGVFTKQGGVLTTIAKRGDPAPIGVFTGGPASLVDHKDGRTAFTMPFDDNRSQGLFVSEGGALTTIAQRGDLTPDGSRFEYFGDVSIDRGGAAFVATDTGSSAVFSGLYHWDGATIREVVRRGIPLFDSFLDRVTLSSSGLEGNDIVFEYRLYNGERGVAIATRVPEMAGAHLAAIAALGCFWRRRTR
jgi:hypothetical protein